MGKHSAKEEVAINLQNMEDDGIFQPRGIGMTLVNLARENYPDVAFDNDEQKLFALLVTLVTVYNEVTKSQPQVTLNAVAENVIYDLDPKSRFMVV